jgi:hypothetical protein
MSKKVFKYNDGTYYAWLGESTGHIVIHKTSLIAEAVDFGGFLHEKDALDGIPRYDGGKLIEVLTHDEALEQLATMTAAKNKAVDALKACAEQMGHTIPYTFAPDGMDALIAQLEEVK